MGFSKFLSEIGFKDNFEQPVLSLGTTVSYMGEVFKQTAPSELVQLDDRRHFPKDRWINFGLDIKRCKIYVTLCGSQSH